MSLTFRPTYIDPTDNTMYINIPSDLPLAKKIDAMIDEYFQESIDNLKEK